MERVSSILVHIGYFSQRLRVDDFGQAVPSLEHARCGQGANDPGNDFTRSAKMVGEPFVRERHPASLIGKIEQQPCQPLLALLKSR